MCSATWLRWRPRPAIYDRPLQRMAVVPTVIENEGGSRERAVDIHAREILRLRQVLNELIAKHTGQPLERVVKDTDRDFYLSPEEAIEYGLIDGLIQPTTPVRELAAAASGSAQT